MKKWKPFLATYQPCAGDKRCSKCGATKDRKTGFYLSMGRRDGATTWCRDCCDAAYHARKDPDALPKFADPGLGARIKTTRDGGRYRRASD